MHASATCFFFFFFLSLYQIRDTSKDLTHHPALLVLSRLTESDFYYYHLFIFRSLLFDFLLLSLLKKRMCLNRFVLFFL